MKRICKVISFLVTLCLLASVCLTGCQAGKLKLPPFEKIYIGMDGVAVRELMGEPAQMKGMAADAKDNVLGYAVNIWTYHLQQRGKITMDVTYFFNSEVWEISFASMNISSGYYGEDGLTDQDMEKLASHSLYIQNYYTEMFGQPEIETEGDYTEYTWYMPDGAELSLRDGAKYGYYNLELWWDFFPKWD